MPRGEKSPSPAYRLEAVRAPCTQGDAEKEARRLPGPSGVGYTDCDEGLLGGVAAGWTEAVVCVWEEKRGWIVHRYAGEGGWDWSLRDDESRIRGRWNALTVYMLLCPN